MSKTSTEINNRPVIGILTMPLSNWLGDNVDLSSRRAKSYLPAAYIKWIENSGAMVVPIQYTATEPILKSYLSQINGFIICGDISPVNYASEDKDTKVDEDVIRWMKAEFIIFQWAKKQNSTGTHFPVLGIGMGYEELIFMNLMPNYYDKLIGSKSVMNFTIEEEPVDEMVKVSDNYFTSSFKLTDTPGIFGSELSTDDKKLFATNNVCYTTPGWVMSAKGNKIKKIKEFIEINSIIKQKKEYINAYSFKEFPFYGMAFHPEAIIYNWMEKGIPQTDAGMHFSHKMSELFVNECRKNLTQIVGTELLIYNYTLFSPDKVLKLLYPENWQTVQLKKHFTNSYFFGIVSHVKKKTKTKTKKKEKTTDE